MRIEKERNSTTKPQFETSTLQRYLNIQNTQNLTKKADFGKQKSKMTFP